jgi:hypothetical protein
MRDQARALAAAVVGHARNSGPCGISIMFALVELARPRGVVTSGCLTAVRDHLAVRTGGCSPWTVIGAHYDALSFSGARIWPWRPM